MTLKEFKELLEENQLYNTIVNGWVSVNCSEERGYCGAVLSESGSSGGNCWGDEATSFSKTEKPADYLEKILELVCPNISFLTFRKLEKLKKNSSYFDSGYYGNYSTSYYEFVDLTSLFEELVKLGLINE